MNVVQVTANKQASREEITSRSLNRWQDKQNEEQRLFFSVCAWHTH